MGAVPYVQKLSEELKGAGWRLYVIGERVVLMIESNLIGRLLTMVMA